MSDNIPLEIQVEIMQRLPLKPLLQFRSVSKQWKSVIDRSEFITARGLHHTQSYLLLQTSEYNEEKFVSIVDDDTLSHHKMITPPIMSDRLLFPRIVGYSRGLVCLLDFGRSNVVFLWNPSLRKCIGITDGSYALGFGVCPKTSDPKLVKFPKPKSETDDWKAEVFTLSSGAWRRVPLNLRLANTKMNFSWSPVATDTSIHWIGYDIPTQSHHVLVSFDLTTEEFEEVNVSFVRQKVLPISKLKGSLVVLDYNKEAFAYDVWMMIKNGGLESSFTKIFTVSFKPTPQTVRYRIMGFRKNGELMVEHDHRLDGKTHKTLEIYDTNSKLLKKCEGDISSTATFHMASYTESLILLNHFDSIIQA